MKRVNGDNLQGTFFKVKQFIPKRHFVGKSRGGDWDTWSGLLRAKAFSAGNLFFNFCRNIFLISASFVPTTGCWAAVHIIASYCTAFRGLVATARFCIELLHI